MDCRSPRFGVFLSTELSRTEALGCPRSTPDMQLSGSISADRVPPFLTSVAGSHV